jgi:3-oxoacyl-[acyl-carrier protein] reductase
MNRATRLVYRDVLLRRWRNVLGRTMWDFPGCRVGGNRCLVLGLGSGQAADLAVAADDDLIAYGRSHAESVDSGILDTTVESFDRHDAVNVRATWLLIAAFARQLPATGGSVVALTSDHTVGNLPYGVTKGGLDRLVLASAHELADAAVRANVINPGPIDTGWMIDEIRASGIAQQPTGRLGTPKDTANLVRFLLSKQGEWINGQLLYSNGGYPKGRLPV